MPRFFTELFQSFYLDIQRPVNDNNSQFKRTMGMSPFYTAPARYPPLCECETL
jgi:hypothetical protein